MSIHQVIKSAIPEALRAHDEVRLRTLRSLVTQMTNEVVAKKRKPDEFLTDEEAVTVIKRAANQRKDSIEQFTRASRLDLAEPEKAELLIIGSYLPSMMSREEIEKFAREKMVEMAKTPEGRSPDAAYDAAFRGKFIGMLMKDLKGKADGGDVKAVVDSLLV